jgi:hypothetical protein
MYGLQKNGLQKSSLQKNQIKNNLKQSPILGWSRFPSLTLIGANIRANIGPNIGATLLTQLLALGLIFPSPSLAEYQPPQGPPPSDHTGANGSRKNCGESAVALTQLGPLSHVGRTSSLTPTLAWFIPTTTPYRLSFKLYGPANGLASTLIYEREQVQTETGIVTLTLPEQLSSSLTADGIASDGIRTDNPTLTSAPTLQMDQRYLWQVAIACDSEGISYDQTFVAELVTVAPAQGLKDALAGADGSIAKAEIYAQAGYWYDALGEVLATEDPTQRDQGVVNLLQDLAPWEDSFHGEALQQIADLIQ